MWRCRCRSAVFVCVYRCVCTVCVWARGRGGGRICVRRQQQQQKCQKAIENLYLLFVVVRHLRRRFIVHSCQSIPMCRIVHDVPSALTPTNYHSKWSSAKEFNLRKTETESKIVMPISSESNAYWAPNSHNIRTHSHISNTEWDVFVDFFHYNVFIMLSALAKPTQQCMSIAMIVERAWASDEYFNMLTIYASPRTLEFVKSTLIWHLSSMIPDAPPSHRWQTQ